MKDGSKIAKKTFVCVAGVAVGLAAFAARHPELIASGSERVKLPVWSGGGWTAGYCPSKIRACECSVSGAILPESVTVTDAAGRELRRGVDFQVEPIWGAVGLCGAATNRVNELMTLT